MFSSGPPIVDGLVVTTVAMLILTLSELACPSRHTTIRLSHTYLRTWRHMNDPVAPDIKWQSSRSSRKTPPLRQGSTVEGDSVCGDFNASSAAAPSCGEILSTATAHEPSTEEWRRLGSFAMPITPSPLSSERGRSACPTNRSRFPEGP